MLFLHLFVKELKQLLCFVGVDFSFVIVYNCTQNIVNNKIELLIQLHVFINSIRQSVCEMQFTANRYHC